MTVMAIAERNGDAEAAAECCSSALTETTLPQQRLVDGKVFPLVLSPSSPSHSAHQACKLLESNRALLEQKLKEHGAVFLRGFPLQSGADLQSVVDALGWLPVPYLGSAPRTQVAGSVYTANDSNPDLFINYHHEMSLIETTDWPSKLLFFCELPSSEGGQTPIIVSHKVTQSLWMRCPDFMQKLEELGLFYIKVLPMEMDPKHYSLQGWPLAFGTSNQKEAEERLVVAVGMFKHKKSWTNSHNNSYIVTYHNIMSFCDVGTAYLARCCCGEGSHGVVVPCL